MSLNRRHFLASLGGAIGATGLSLTGCSLLPAKANSLKKREYVGASKRNDGRYAVQSLNSDGTQRWQTLVEARCHGGCFRPNSAQVLIFERRPGWWFHVFDSRSGERLAHIKANDGEHFYGHGVFSTDGRYLYATASRYQHGDGIIAVYDAQASYARVNTLDLKGIGPHELRLHPDSQTLVIALGGIKTHPDYDRIKMNLESMAPALMMMDRTSGEIRARFSPSQHQLSCRHLDVTPQGHIYAGYQYQGPNDHTPSLIARYRNGRFDEVEFTDDVQPQLANYISSVSAHPQSDLVAVTAPRGGRALIFEGATGRILRNEAITDGAGVEALDGGDFLVTTGHGKLIRMGINAPALELATLPLHWDNHLV
ncbi:MULTISPECIES: DUF1513 domain-containing protein [unclassified Marinobacter]|uniref:DUF1513 domain-containing protein n=1 Tax=unclassified Marinobacter TaxID=83889 RepID=UPI00200C933A|nr:MULTISPECIES: DUF1513 domain-containing protein [unclassified Marinobacter]MCL1487099.1 DUF1513 domain-containing protein [Marinobacter sp.]UQG54778.1 DUF1513 domain-containing protein [Marinobacter sp. M4C]UQG63580.1 DUF1513 domain-containing protein [Marinobacter sp. M2C]UQG67863.1 DUF1513 domain-containing protein [Marinobacter sp. M1C]